MKPVLVHLPRLLVALAVAALLWYGPIPQWPDYHRFADQSYWHGIPHAADVLSNAGFALVGLWAAWRLLPYRGTSALVSGGYGWALFLAGLVLTAFGSAYYHLAPDNFRLVWDRLPIALACAGLLSAVAAETRPGGRSGALALGLGLFGIASVVWWHYTESLGQGDLRPYLLLQGLPLLLVPLWQAGYGTPNGERSRFGLALLLYALAKLTELNDHVVLELTGWLSGHTLKHLLAALAAAVIVWALIRRAEGENLC